MRPVDLSISALYPVSIKQNKGGIYSLPRRRRRRKSKKPDHIFDQESNKHRR